MGLTTPASAGDVRMVTNMSSSSIEARTDVAQIAVGNRTSNVAGGTQARMMGRAAREAVAYAPNSPADTVTRPVVVAQNAAAPPNAVATTDPTMSNQGTSAFPWWAWLVIAVIIVAAILFFMRSRNAKNVSTTGSVIKSDPTITTRH